MEYSLVPYVALTGLSVAAASWFIRDAVRTRVRLKAADSTCERLFASSPDGIITMDLHGVIRRGNVRAAEMFGTTLDELSGFRLTDALAVGSLDDILAAAGSVQPVEVGIRRRDGGDFSAELTVTAPLETDTPLIQVTIRDITRRRRAEASLKESEQRLRLMSDASFEGMIIHDEGDVLDVNRRMMTLVGVDHVSVGTDFYSFIHPDDREFVRMRVRENYTEPYEFRLVRADGTAVPVEAHGRPLPFRGRTVRVVAIRDITERHTAERMLRQRLRLEMAMANVSALFVSNREPSMNRMLEILCSVARTAESWLILMADDGVTFMSVRRWRAGDETGDVVPFPDRRAQDFDWWVTTMEREMAVIIDDTRDLSALATKQLGEFPVPLPRSLAAVPLSAPDGTAFGYLAVAENEPRVWSDEDMRALRMAGDMFTAWRQRRRAEAALAAEEEYFRSLIEHITDAITVMDTSGIISYVSPSVTKITGFAPDELLGTGFFDWIHPDDVSGVVEVFSDVMSSIDRSRPAEFRMHHADGDWRTLDAMGKSFRDAAGRVRVIMNTRDITDRRILERQLSQSQKMEAVGRLAGGVAHDFNNLMTVILGHTYMMADRLDDTEQLGRDIEEIRDSAERAAELTRQLLAFSRRQVIKPKLLDLNAVIADIEKMLRRVITENIELNLDLAVHPTNVMMDPGQVEQVLMNLVVNARDAMPDGGRIDISTSRQTIEGERAARMEMTAGDYIRLAVIDTGSGMDEEVKRHIFEPFFTTKEVGKGTGLGLATVYGVAAQAGGRITVDSEPDKGTAFSILIPAATGVADAPRHTARPAMDHHHGGTETVLLVEDDAALRTMVTEVLTECGYTVHPAASGDEAMGVFAANGAGIDVLLTDMVLPGAMNGPMVADSIRTRKPSVRVLFMSGYADIDVAGGLKLEAGLNFVQKPFVPARLLTVLRNCIEHAG